MHVQPCCTASGCVAPAAARTPKRSCVPQWTFSSGSARVCEPSAHAQSCAPPARPCRSPPPELLDQVTPQELQVVRLAASGLSNRAIGAQLFLSPRTVGYHLYKAYPKLGVAPRAELARLGVEAS